MEDVRRKYHYHPMFGVVIKDDKGNYYDVDRKVGVPEGAELETVYERDRRLWVEQATLKEFVEIDRQSNEDEMKLLTQYYYKAYNIIQNTITNLNQ